MKFSVTEDSWVLDQLHPAEWHFICELPLIAAGRELGEKRAREVLLPDPLSLEDSQGEEEFIEDWQEFVQPDLAAAFESDRSKVATDLESAEMSDPPEIGLPENASPEQIAMLEKFRSLTWRKLTISLDHVEPWYSALNQARLMMNEKHELAEDEARFMGNVIRETDDGMEPDRALLMTQYEFYSIVQSILIDQLMEP